MINPLGLSSDRATRPAVSFRPAAIAELRALVPGQRHHRVLDRARPDAKAFRRDIVPCHFVRCRRVPCHVVGDRSDKGPGLVEVWIKCVGICRNRWAVATAPETVDAGRGVLARHTTATSSSVSSAPDMAHFTVGALRPAEPSGGATDSARTPSCTRAEKCSQKRGDGSGISASAARDSVSRMADAFALQVSQTSRCRARADASVPSTQVDKFDVGEVCHRNNFLRLASA